MDIHVSGIKMQVSRAQEVGSHMLEMVVLNDNEQPPAVFQREWGERKSACK